MQGLTAADLHILRQVSVTFRRLYEDKTFDDVNDLRHHLDEETVRRARENGFCSPCLAERLRPDWRKRLQALGREKSLACSICKENHTRVDFSHTQRMEPASTRQCIGATSYIQLCPHMKMSLFSMWHKIAAVMKDLPKAEDWRSVAIEKCSQCEEIDASVDTTNSAWRHLNYPTLSVYDCFPKDRRMAFLSWALPVFSTTDSSVITDTFLKTKLRAFRQKYGDVFCPHIRDDYSQLLLSLDPGRCYCLGEDSRGGGMSLSGNLGTYMSTLCHDAGPPQDGERVFLGNTYHVWSCKCCSIYNWARYGTQIFLMRRSGFEISKQKPGWDMNAHGMLNPDGFDVTSDQETKHILWCWSQSCRNGRDRSILSRVR